MTQKSILLLASLLLVPFLAVSASAAEVNSSALSQNGWYSDDTRADGTVSQLAGTNLKSPTLTDAPESGAGNPLHDPDILNQILFGPAPAGFPGGTHPGAVWLRIAAGAGAGKSQLSHRKDDGTGHAPGSVFGPGFLAEYSWMGNGTVSNTASLKIGIKTAEFGSTGVSSRTGENAWDKVFIYEPGNLNGGISDGTWRTETVTHTSGTWWFFDRTAGASIIGTPMTLADMAGALGAATIVGGGPKTAQDVYNLVTAAGAHITSIQFGIGSGNAGGSVYVNQLATNFYRSGDVTTFGSLPVHNITQSTDHITIQDGVDNANSGDVLLVDPGTYAGANITKGITLQGPNAGICAHGAVRGPEAVINSGSPSIRVSTTEPVVIDGMKFDGTGIAIDSYTAGANITMENDIFVNTTTQTFFFGNPDFIGFDCNYVSNNAADEECLFIAGDWDGSTGTVVSITDNLWENTLSTGSNLSSVSGSITGNTFDNVQYYAILLANQSEVTISGNTFDGIVNPDPVGVPTWGAGVRFYTPTYPGPVTITGNYFLNSHAGVSVRPSADISALPITVSGNDFVGNTYGILHDGVGTLAASCNWWGDSGGPDVSPGNPNPAGDDLDGTAVYWPWLDGSIAGSPSCNQYGDDLVAAEVPSCITPATPCVTVPVNFNRVDTSHARGITVTFLLSPELQLCVDPATSIQQGTWLNGFLSGFQVVDNGGGSYTVDQAILGAPCGTTSGGELFTVDVERSGGDGTGTITVTAVDVRDCGNPFGYLPGIPGPPAEITIDYSPPSAAAVLGAAQVLNYNDGDGTTGITLTWLPVEAGATVAVYRKGFGFYPEYDDDGGAAPSAPATPALALGNGWALTTVTSSGGIDETATTRDYYYYVAFVTDLCGNVSAVSNRTNGTLNYHLGDVVPQTVAPPFGDNLVDVLDISKLGAHYGTQDGNPAYLDTLDVGPTTNNGTSGRPTTDNRIQFEDLILIAINYGQVSKPGAVEIGANELALQVPELPAVGETFDVAVTFSAGGGVLGLSVPLSWSKGVVVPVAYAGGELLERQQGFGVILSPVAGTIDAAVFGASFSGEGVLGTVTFRVVSSGNADIGFGTVEARDALNRPVPVETRVAGNGNGWNRPAVTRLLPGAPNPFLNSTTIAFQLQEDASVQLRIFDIDGRLVQTLVEGPQSAGERSVIWNGQDESGRTVAAGTYFVEFRTPRYVESHRLVRLQ